MAVRRAEKTRITSGEIDWVSKESDTDYHEQFDGGSFVAIACDGRLESIAARASLTNALSNVGIAEKGNEQSYKSALVPLCCTGKSRVALKWQS